MDAYVTLQRIVVAGAKYLYACEDARSCLKDYFQHPTAEGFSARKNPNSQSIEDYFFKAMVHSGVLFYLNGYRALETSPRRWVGLQDHQPAPWSLRVAAWLVAGFVRGEASGKLRTVEGEGVENWKILVL